MPNFTSRAGALALAFLFLVVSLACSHGGGGNTSVTPTPSQGIEYRLAMILPTPNGGKEITTGMSELQNVTIYQGKETTFQVRHEYRSHQGSSTTPWTETTEACRLNVSVYGSESGRPLPDLGLAGGQDQRIQGNLQLEFFPPSNGNQGFAMIEMSVTETGAYLNVGIWVAIGTGGQVNPPPPVKTCRELHPCKENVAGWWWDCINGDWRNTGVPVNPPPPPPVTYTFRGFGAQGEFKMANPIKIKKGNGYKLDLELWGSDGSKVKVPANNVLLCSDLPDWVWDESRSEIETVFWVNPSNPSLDDPGNMYVEPGKYQLEFETSYSGAEYSLKGTLEVLFNPDIP